jgi:O-succinylbenzoate synthase
MRVERLEIWAVELPLQAPFASATKTFDRRQSLILRVHTDVGSGWGECVAFEEPFYTSEFNGGATAVIEQFCWPLLRSQKQLSGALVAPALASLKGHPMAKSALEMAVLDAELRAAGESFAAHLGASVTEVEVGVAVGIHDEAAALVETVAAHVAEGYSRVKLKVQPGNDVIPVRAVRAELGEDILLQVDANGSYDPGEVGALVALDDLDLLLIEQPFAEGDLLGHARLAERLKTPICLDESVTSVETARQVLELGACSTINLKPGRVGGYLEAVKIHDLAARWPAGLWCGGMFEMGLARAANLALAALPGFTLPGDISATNRYFHTDITEPFVLHDGRLPVPDGPGIGIEPDTDAIKHFGFLVADLR